MDKTLEKLTVGGRLAHWRDQAGMNQEDFARKMGVSRSTQANYELDKRLPDFAYLAMLKSQGYPIGWLMGDAYMAADQKPLTPEEAMVLGCYQRANTAGKIAIEQVARIAADAAKS